MSRTAWGETVIPDRVAKRAATRFVVEGECYISTYSVASHGYAQIGWQDGAKNYGTTAHRASWVYHYGQIPVRMTIDHSSSSGCQSRRCIRKEHLRMLPNLENARRTSGRDWPVGKCVHGHGHEWWLPKGPIRKKGYCKQCRIEMYQRMRNEGAGPAQLPMAA